MMRRLPFLLLPALCGLTCGLGAPSETGSTGAALKPGSGEGAPTTGDNGISVGVDDIMTRGRAHAAATNGHGPPREQNRRLVANRESIPHDPYARGVSRWPPRRNENNPPAETT